MLIIPTLTKEKINTYLGRTLAHYEGLKLGPGEVGSPEAQGWGQSCSKSSCPLLLGEFSKLRQGQGGKVEGPEVKRISAGVGDKGRFSFKLGNSRG